MVTIPDHILKVGGCGLAGGGKTWLLDRLRISAGVGPDALVECSGPIVPLAELYRQFLYEYVFGSGRNGSVMALLHPNRIVPAILEHAPAWLSSVSDGLVPEVPDSAFANLSHLDQDVAGLLTAQIVNTANMVVFNHKNYVMPITVANKSTGPIRPLLTAINMLVSNLACQWLRENGHPDVHNLWPYLAMRRLEQVHARHPDWPLLIINGLRMPGDDHELHSLGGIVLERRFPSADVDASHAALPTEQPGNVIPDYIIFGDCRVDDRVDELQLVADHVWWLLREGLLEAGQGNGRILFTGELLACEGSHTACLAA